MFHPEDDPRGPRKCGAYFGPGFGMSGFPGEGFTFTLPSGIMARLFCQKFDPQLAGISDCSPALCSFTSGSGS